MLEPRTTKQINIFGGGKRDRTDDLLHAMQALSQLSYTPRIHESWVPHCSNIIISHLNFTN